MFYVNIDFNDCFIDVDYNINKNSIIFISRIPQAGDLILLNINLSKLFTNNLSDQLRILSPYPLQLNPGNSSQSFINSKVFGETSYLYPGKDENDEFYFWINRKTGYWKWLKTEIRICTLNKIIG